MASEDEVPHASEKWNLFSWVQGAGVHRIIAGALRHALSQAGLGDDPDAMLGFLRALKDREDLAKLLHSSSMLEALVDLMWGEVETLQRAGAATSTELQSKFAGSVELSYQGLDSFFGGLEGIVGPPNPMLLQAMTDDHTDGHGTESTDEFVTGNYGVRTSSKIEWLYVYDPEVTPDQLKQERWPEESAEKLPDRGRCRSRRTLDEIWDDANSRNLDLEKANQPGLVKEEVLAANLYTGPVCAHGQLAPHSDYPW